MSAVGRVLRDLSPASLAAGLVAVLVGFTSSAVIVFQATKAAGATPAQAQAGSWMWALGLGMDSVHAGPP